MTRAAPLLAAGVLLLGGLLSLGLSTYSLRLLNLAVIAAVAVIGLNFSFGYAGLISLGHAAFVGLGAYAFAILTTRAGWAPWPACLASILGTGLAAAVVGTPLLRLRGHYLALATLGLNVSAVLVAGNWVGLTGGTDGITGIPTLSVAGRTLAGERPFLLFGLVLLCLGALLAEAVRHSRFGRAMIAVRDDETASAMTGVNVTATRVAAFALSAAYAAVSGCLFATHLHFVSPDDFTYARSITYLSMLIVGGEGSVIGAVLGALLLTFLPEWLRVLGDGYLAFFGLMMLAILVFCPSGMVGLLRRVRRTAVLPVAAGDTAVQP